jgi:hypothetical protein
VACCRSPSRSSESRWRSPCLCCSCPAIWCRCSPRWLPSRRAAAAQWCAPVPALEAHALRRRTGGRIAAAGGPGHGCRVLPAASPRPRLFLDPRRLWAQEHCHDFQGREQGAWVVARPCRRGQRHRRVTHVLPRHPLPHLSILARLRLSHHGPGGPAPRPARTSRAPARAPRAPRRAGVR